MKDAKEIALRTGEVTALLRQQPRFRDTVCIELVQVFAALWCIYTTDNEFRVTDWYGDRYLKPECLGLIKDLVGCSEEDLKKHLRFLEDHDAILFAYVPNIGECIQVIFFPKLTQEA